METLLGKHWHHLPIPEALDLLGSDAERGLDPFDVRNRQDRFGPNVLCPPKGPGPLKRFLLQFHQALVYILIGAGAITALFQEWVDSGVIFGVVLVNAVIGFVQESKAVEAIAALARAMTTEATVLRAGEKRRVSAADVVPGDIVFLQAGDKVPADVRLIRSRDLQVDESALTGESVPVDKRPDPLPRETVLADRSNVAYASTLVTYGQGQGVVIATGDHTEVGRISHLIAMTEELQTPLTRRISRFSRLLLYAIVGLAVVTFLAGFARGQSVFDMFMAAVALAVGAIPEGLPAAVTITLAMGVSRMARRRAIIRKLPAVETLGSITVICSDKTGTLTENQMTVQEIRAGDVPYAVSGVGYTPSGQILRQGIPVDPPLPPPLAECLTAGLLCNDSLLVDTEGRWTVEGDPTEGALMVSARKGGLSREALCERLPRIDTLPFDSQHQYMATLHDAGADQRRIVYVKGAVEAVLHQCTTVLTAVRQPDHLPREIIRVEAERMAVRGLRVLAFARGERPAATLTLTHADLVSGLTFLGLQGMIDPPRPEAVSAVRACRAAGISVKMVTGDHALTASAIARQLGLDAAVAPTDTAPGVLTGRSMAELSDVDVLEAAERTVVFARVTPEQKLRLVEALQARGHVVAVTGDGVNDAPALKRADIGVAMGIGGTDVAKEAAAMVLTDDNFASIEAAIEEGRGVFDNLTKFMVWTLPTNVGEGLVISAAVFAGVTLPILPVQILWINMTTAVLLGLTLAFEAKEPGIMTRPPRDPKQPILTRELKGRILLVGGLLLIGAFGLFEWEERRGAPVAEARTVAVNVFVMVSVFYLFSCRSLTKAWVHLGFASNPWMLGGVALMLALQGAYTYLPAMNRLFHSAPIGWNAWVRILVVAIVASLMVGVEKWIRGRASSSDRASPWAGSAPRARDAHAG